MKDFYFDSNENACNLSTVYIYFIIILQAYFFIFKWFISNLVNINTNLNAEFVIYY